MMGGQLYIHAPSVAHCAAVIDCPTCDRPRRMHGAFAEWYGVTWTCAGCGDKWSDGERHGRPLSPGWRRRNIEMALANLALIGVQA